MTLECRSQRRETFLLELRMISRISERKVFTVTRQRVSFGRPVVTIDGIQQGVEVVLDSVSLRIALSCQPAILNKVLVSVLGTVPEFVLVEPKADHTDVVITTGRGVGTFFDDPWVYPKPSKLIITIDRPRNTLYVRRTAGEQVGIELLPGELDQLIALLNREVAKQRLRLLGGRSA